MSEAPIAVLKFGSSVLRDERDLPRAVHEIYRLLRRGQRVVAVVSALGGATDELVRRAAALRSSSDEAHYAALLETGESAAAAALCIALERAGVFATRFDARDAGLVSEGPRLDALPRKLDAARLHRALEHRPVVVLPGFVGRCDRGDCTLFGRGGSDLTALFVAERLGAESCRLIKDVDGLYERDPAKPGPAPRRYAAITWRDALRLGGGIVQEKAIRYARNRQLEFAVTSLGSESVTRVGRGPTRLGRGPARPAPLRVALLGLGTVGGGLWRELLAAPEDYEVIGALVRDQQRHLDAGLPAELLETDVDRLLHRPIAVLVELVGNRPVARHAIERALRAGIDVVSANKAVIAECSVELEALAAKHGASLRYSAAVGGSLPMVETLARLGERGCVRAFDGVLNGTTNYVLDAVTGGASFDQAVADAQAAGFAEADPRFDLDGTDAAQKLEILARQAFGPRAILDWRGREGITELDAALLRHEKERGRVARLVASGVDGGDGVRLEVRLRFLSETHSLAGARGEGNTLLVHRVDGSVTLLSGKGAGRWPTTEAVFADLGELLLEHRRTVSPKALAV